MTNADIQAAILSAGGWLQDLLPKQTPPSREELAAQQAQHAAAYTQTAASAALEEPWLNPVDTVAGGLAGLARGPLAAGADMLLDIPVSLALEAMQEENPEALKAMYIGKRGMKNLGIDAGQDLAGQFSALHDRMPRLEIDDSAAKGRDYNLTPAEAYKDARWSDVVGTKDGFVTDRVNKMSPYSDMTKNQLQEEYRRTGGEIVNAAKSGDIDLAYKLQEDRSGLDSLLTAMSSAKYGPMSRFLKHGDFGAAYPDVYNMHTRITPDELGDSNGQYLRGNGHIGEQIKLSEKPIWSKPKGTALHELQHAVQEREGFARGGSASVAQWADMEARPGLVREYEKLIENAKKPISFEEYRRSAWGGEPTNDRMLDAYNEYAVETRAGKNLGAQDRAFQEQAARNYYTNLAGEIEARDTAARMQLSPEERARTQPYSGYAAQSGELVPTYEPNPIPLDDFIVRHEAGQSMSLPMDEASRMQRAREMGFDTDTVYYHGTPEEAFDEFLPDDIGKRFKQSIGIHTSNSRNEAMNYKPPTSGHVKEMYAAPENTLEYFIPEGGPFTTASMKADIDTAEIIEKLVEAKRSGSPYDSVRIQKQIPGDWDEWNGANGLNENLIMLDPSKLRSTSAAFDKTKKNSANLLASTIPLIAYLGSQEE